jgi:hypothetical protein
MWHQRIAGYCGKGPSFMSERIRLCIRSVCTMFRIGLADASQTDEELSAISANSIRALANGNRMTVREWIGINNGATQTLSPRPLYEDDKTLPTCRKARRCLIPTREISSFNVPCSTHGHANDCMANERGVTKIACSTITQYLHCIGKEYFAA